MNRVSGCGVMNRPALTCDEGKAERKGQDIEIARTSIAQGQEGSVILVETY